MNNTSEDNKKRIKWTDVAFWALCAIVVVWFILQKTKVI